MKSFPVIETFGPTVQGEGVLAGVPTYFVRFGGCDYRCSWCDSMYAVDPPQVRANATKMTAPEIAAAIAALPSGPAWVTLSGGNPALLDLHDLVGLFIDDLGLSVAVETQGSRWRGWLAEVNCLTVSPKPPSSSMADKTAAELPRFMALAAEACRGGETDALKIVVFDDADYAWARQKFREYPGWPSFISAGTDPVGVWGSEVVAAEGHSYALQKIANRYAWLCDKVAADSEMSHVRVLPQLHVVAYGHARGV